MNEYEFRKHISIFLVIILAVSISSCIDIYLPKSDSIIHLYTSPKISNYKIEKVGLLPMVRDDTTSFGTFYSTNYFLQKLRLKFPKKSFELINTDKIIEYDSLVIPNLVQSIENEKHLDLNNFYSYELNSLIQEKNTDAILIGTLNDKENSFGSFYDVRYRSFTFTYTTGCEFSYYLISLRDGRVLWKVDVYGKESYYYETVNATFPPMDAAISRGIDSILTTIPL